MYSTSTVLWIKKKNMGAPHTGFVLYLAFLALEEANVRGKEVSWCICGITAINRRVS